MSDELRPCPFCGGAAVNSHWGLIYCGQVNKCGTGTAVSARGWNSRPIEDALRARIRELEHAMPDVEILRALFKPDGELEAHDCDEIIHNIDSVMRKGEK